MVVPRFDPLPFNDFAVANALDAESRAFDRLLKEVYGTQPTDLMRGSSEGGERSSWWGRTCEMWSRMKAISGVLVINAGDGAGGTVMNAEIDELQATIKRQQISIDSLARNLNMSDATRRQAMALISEIRRLTVEWSEQHTTWDAAQGMARIRNLVDAWPPKNQRFSADGHPFYMPTDEEWRNQGFNPRAPDYAFPGKVTGFSEDAAGPDQSEPRIPPFRAFGGEIHEGKTGPVTLAQVHIDLLHDVAQAVVNLRDTVREQGGLVEALLAGRLPGREDARR